VRVVIGEDHLLMREGLKLVLERAGFTIEAMAEDALSLVRRARALRPDLVVADIQMPPDNADDGLRAVLELRAEHPELPVIVLSQHVHREYATELLETGEQAVGYLLKQRVADLERFVADLHRVVAGGTVLDPVVVSAMIGRARPQDALANLTDHQRDVLALMAEGLSNAAIATRLGITERGVVRNVSRIYDRMGIDQDANGHRRVLAVVQHLSR
jgi:DNA-binding NarL/FixJ family response regulator